MPQNWTTHDRRLGFWSAIMVPGLGLIYLICGAAGIGLGDERSWKLTLPIEPFVTICRILMLTIIPALLLVFVAVHRYCTQERRICSLSALAFAIVFATISGANNLLLLTTARNADPDGVLGKLIEFRWPSVIMTLELFAWGPVLGLALLFAAPAFQGQGLRAAVRRGMIIGGLLCLGNVLCFVTGDVSYCASGIIGYDFVVPVVCLMLAVLFRRTDRVANEKHFLDRQ